MKRRVNRIGQWLDPHLFLVWLLIAPAAMPLLQPTITNSADGFLHLYRVVALKHALDQGQAFFPRWLPDLAYGYGFPLFIFYAPLSYYITLVLILAGLKTAVAFNTSFVIALFTAGTGVYLFVKDRFGPKAGVVAGVAYVYAPFQLLNSLSRGGLPAAWAMALFPFVFWLFGRLIRRSVGDRRLATPLIPLSALVLGAGLLMHNTLSLLFVPLLGLYLFIGVFVAYLVQSATAEKLSLGWTILRLGLAAALGFGLAAFFLIPAMVEKDFAQVDRVITSPDFDFRFNFVTLSELVSLQPPANTGLLNPSFPLSLGLAQVGLGALGLAGLIVLGLRRAYYLFHNFGQTGFEHSVPSNWAKDAQGQSSQHTWFVSPDPAITIFALVALAIAVCMMLPISVHVWEALPLLAYVQFPHRWLGPTALVLAILAGAAVAILPARVGFGLMVLGIILIFITSAPLLYPRYHDQFPSEPTLIDMMTYEHKTGAIGTTSFGEYLPIWVRHVPSESPLEPMYRTGAVIARLDPAYLPSDAEVESASYGFNQAEFNINSPQPFQAIFHTFYFPGWEAFIDGQASLITPATERGLVSVPMPSGRHHLRLHFGETPLRQAANLLTILALVLLLIFLAACCIFRRSYLTRPDTIHRARVVQGDAFSRSFSPAQLSILAGIALVIIATKVLYLDRFDNPLKQTFDGARVARADISRTVNFGDQINLLGYNLTKAVVQPGEYLNFTAYWQARQPLPTNYSSLAQLVDTEQHLYAGQDNLHPGRLKTTLWQPWGFVQDPHFVPVPPGTPPGDYLLVTGLYDPVTWARLPVIGDGAPERMDVFAVQVAVTRPSRPPTVDELGISWSVTVDIGTDLRLLGATPERATIPRNDFLRIALFWEALKVPTQDYRISLRLLAPDGTVALQKGTRPSHSRYPTRNWAAGERVRDNHALRIPPDFPAGSYRVQVQVTDAANEPIVDWLELGLMTTTE